MKKLIYKVRKYNTLVFVDLEGTQFSHEAIAIGAVKAKINKENFQIKKLDKGFKVYVKPHNPIGGYVKKLTGITDELLEEKGIPFKDAIKKFVSYCGRDFKNTLFVTFGSHDARIFNQSLLHSSDANAEDVRHIVDNNLDLLSILNEYIRDQNNNTYSLANYLRLYNVNFEGQEHDCLCDARNLAYLYNEVLHQPEILYDEYLGYLSRKTNMPRPIVKLVQKVVKEGDADYDDFMQFVKDDVTYVPPKKRKRD